MEAKARLLVEDYNQVEGADSLEIFAPTPATEPIRMVTAILLEHDLNIAPLHLGAEQAFVQSEPDEDIFMRPYTPPLDVETSPEM